MTSDDLEHDYLSADQLRVGVFVVLDLPWFKHDFALSSFKVRTEDQLRELRGLKLTRYRYDPARSDPLPGLSPGRTDNPHSVNVSMNGVHPEPSDVQAIVDVDKHQRVAMIEQRRANIAQVEKAFSKAATVMKSMSRNIYTHTQETLEEVGVLVEDMVKGFLSRADATLHVMGDKSGGEDVYFHSLNVTILSMMLAKGLGLSADVARQMGIGALLHDIGLTEIPDRIVRKPASESNKAERNLRATHVELGTALGARIGLPEHALAVVAQHHEFDDGSGYPLGLKGNEINPAAKVVALVNFYDNMCNPADMGRAMTPHEALSYMFAQCRSKFDAQALQLLIRSLGVHPPGSILLLSDQTLAVVTSVNPKKPLRPWVLVYDEHVPKNEAITLNLEQEPHLSIIKSIRPGQLSPKVSAYLNPRKKITYFFDSSSPEEQTGAR